MQTAAARIIQYIYLSVAIRNEFLNGSCRAEIQKALQEKVTAITEAASAGKGQYEREKLAYKGVTQAVEYAYDEDGEQLGVKCTYERTEEMPTCDIPGITKLQNYSEKTGSIKKKVYYFITENGEKKFIADYQEKYKIYYIGDDEQQSTAQNGENRFIADHKQP